MGRQTTITIEATQEICARLAKGEPLAWICRDDHLPAVRTVSDWCAANSDFAADFARARDDGFDAIATDCLNIADDNRNDVRFVENDIEISNQDNVQRAKLRIDTRLKLLAKWDVKRYGDKIAQDVNHSGSVVTKIEREIVSPQNTDS